MLEEAEKKRRTDPRRELLLLSGPATVSGLSFATMGVLDAAFMARVGEAELAGVGLGQILVMALLAFGCGALRGVKVLIAQHAGPDLRVYAARCAAAGLCAALLLGAGTALVGQLLLPLGAVLCASEASARAFRSYLAIRTLGAPVILAYVALRETRYGLGDTRAPAWIALAGNVLHGLLCYTALFVLDLGVSGAALSGVLAMAVQLVFMASLERLGRDSFGLGLWARLRQLLTLGAPTGAHFLIEIGSLAVLSSILAASGDREIAAHQTALRAVSFSMLPALALADSATVLVARALRGGRLRQVHGIARAALWLGLTYALGCAVALTLGGGVIAGWLVDDLELGAALHLVLVAAAVQQIFDASATVAHGVLRGAGGQRTSALVAGLCAWSVTPLFGFLFIRRLGLGAVGGWMALGLEMIAVSTLLWWHLGRSGWVAAARRARRGLPLRNALAA